VLKFNQLVVFFLSYLINFLVLFGYNYQFVIAISFTDPLPGEKPKQKLEREAYDY
jgi:hypothetical protein